MALSKVLKNGKEWTKEDIKNLLSTNAKAVQKAITILYSYQTDDEQVNKETSHVNHKGFNQFDADILSSFAEQLNNGRTLSQKQLALAFKRMPKYAGQILAHMAKEQEEQDMEQLKEKAQMALMKMSFAVWATQEGGKCGCEQVYLYTGIELNDCHANADVTEVTADLTVYAWNGGNRRTYNVIYKQEPDKISGEDLRNYIVSQHPDVDFESVADYYEMEYGESLYGEPLPAPEKWDDYEKIYSLC